MSVRRAAWLAGAAGALACAPWARCAASGPPDPAGANDAALAELIQQHPDDDRVATWQVDRAVAELASLSADGAGTSLLFGVPTRDQRRRGAEAARRALALLDEADASAAASVRRLEQGMMGAGAAGAEAARRAEAAEGALSRLVDVEQAQRIPYFRAVAKTLLAASSDGPSPSRAQLARDGAAALARLRLGTPDAEAARRLMLVGAIVNGTATGDQARDAARAELDHVAALGRALDPTTRARLTMARVLLAEKDDERPAAEVSAPEREARARRLIERARLDPGSRGRLTAEACRVLLAGLPPGSLRPGGADAERLRLYGRIAELIAPGVEAPSLLPEAVLARAVTLLRHDERSQEARALLSALVERPGVPADVLAAALWEAGAAFSRDAGAGGDARAIGCLDRFVREFGTDAQAPAAARTLEALAGRALLAPGLAEARRTELEDVRLRALDLLIAHPEAFPDQLGEWRSREVAMRVARLDPATVTPAQLGPLVRRAASIAGPGAADAGAAINTLAHRMLDGAWARRPASERVALIEIVRSAPGFTGGDGVALLAGEAALEAGRGDASAELRPLIGGALDAPGQPTRARLRLALAAALGGTPAGRTEAVALLRELVAPLDSEPSSVERPAYYWRAWATTLEYLRADDADGSRDAAIRAQARRLELLDPNMGGPETGARIRRARDSAGAGGRPR